MTLVNTGSVLIFESLIEFPALWTTRSVALSASMEDTREEDVIALAVDPRAALIQMDGRDGVRIARGKGLRVAAPSVFFLWAPGIVLSILPKPSNG